MLEETLLKKCEENEEIWTALRCVAMLNWAPHSLEMWLPWDKRLRNLLGVDNLWCYPSFADCGKWKPAQDPFSKLFKNPPSGEGD